MTALTDQERAALEAAAAEAWTGPATINGVGKVFIMADFAGRVDYDCSLARAGFSDLDIECDVCRPIDRVELSRSTMLVGGLHDLRSDLRRHGRRPPRWLDYPPEFVPFYGRKVWSETWGELNKRSGEFFVKRAGKTNFQPMVARFPYDYSNPPEGVDPYNVMHVDDDVTVLVSEPVRFVSEWRAFVVEGEIVDVRGYRGDWRLRPSVEIIEGAHDAFRPAMRGYCIDFGVTDDGRTLVVEANAGYSLGAYGLKPESYARLLAAAWPTVWGSEESK